jgi:hypothetical protein
MALQHLLQVTYGIQMLLSMVSCPVIDVVKPCIVSCLVIYIVALCNVSSSVTCGIQMMLLRMVSCPVIDVVKP